MENVGNWKGPRSISFLRGCQGGGHSNLIFGWGLTVRLKLGSPRQEHGRNEKQDAVQDIIPDSNVEDTRQIYYGDHQTTCKWFQKSPSNRLRSSYSAGPFFQPSPKHPKLQSLGGEGKKHCPHPSARNPSNPFKSESPRATASETLDGPPSFVSTLPQMHCLPPPSTATCCFPCSHWSNPTCHCSRMPPS